MSASTRGQEVLPRDVGRTRALKVESTQRLLGDTIAISDADWQRPSLLPGWTRAHVATHLAHNAAAFSRAINGRRKGETVRMYPSERERIDALERGSERGALQLQIDLDTTAGEMALSLDEAEGLPPDTPIIVNSRKAIRLDLVPLARLNEVVLHHVDLGTGFRLDQLDGEIARLLLAWNSFWISGRADYPSIELESESGFTARLGGRGAPLHVNGPDNLLLGWLTGRMTADQFAAAQLPTLPLSC